MSDELREKMIALIREGFHDKPFTPENIAKAAIALARDDALEEAAQFIEEHSARYDDANRPLLIKRPLFDSVGKPYAAAIRAMKGKPWNCPIKHPGCTSNCGNYGCGN